MIGLILENWKIIVIGILLAALAGMSIYIKSLTLRNDILVSEKNVLVAELQVSQASVKGLQQGISDQNSAVEKLKLDADTRAAIHATEIASAQIKSSNYRKQANALLKQLAPQNLSKCDAANQLFIKEIGNAK